MQMNEHNDLKRFLAYSTIWNINIPLSLIINFRIYHIFSVFFIFGDTYLL